MRIAIPALALLPAVALAGSPLDGTWKLRAGSVKTTGKPDSRVVVDGLYSCASCVPALEKVPADGTFHKVSGHAYYDAIRVRVVSASAIEITLQRGGRPAAMTTYTVSDDGHTIQGRFTDYSGTVPATGSFSERRVGAAPPGAHLTSGAWLIKGLADFNDAASVSSYRMTSDGFSMKMNGLSYDAKFDGKQYPVVGDPGGTLVTLKKINDHTVLEADYRQGRLVEEVRLSATGDTLKLTDRNVAHGQTMTMIFDRHP